ncbi:MAG: 6-hydroxymethylpterin diphosphokinase MptE-like protein [Myxococcota bacterium]
MGSDDALERLRRAHPALAARVLASDASGVEVGVARDGGATLAEAGRRWASAYAPLDEARRWVDALGEGADVAVVLGLGAAHHVDALLARGAGCVLVLEPSAARLRALLEHGGALAWLDDERVDLALDAAGLARAFAARYAPGMSVRVFAHPVLEKHDPEEAGAVLRRIAEIKSARDVVERTRVWKSAEWLAQTARNTARMLESHDFAELAGAFAGRPAVVVAAGPSLDKQLALLAEYRDRVLVIAIGQTLRVLRAAGIEPDLVHVLEAQDVVHQLTGAGSTDDVDLVVSPNAHPGLYEVPVRRRFVAYAAPHRFAGWVRDQVAHWRPVESGASVSLSAVALAGALGARPVLVIGQDLAFTGGRTYAAHSLYEGVGARADGQGRVRLSNVRAKAELFGIPSDDDVFEEARWVDGWDGEKVLTTASYATFIEEYTTAAAALAGAGTRLVNCTEGGAHLPGVEHARFADELARHARERFDARAVVDACAQPPPADARARLARGIGRARARLRTLARTAERGRRAVERVLPHADRPRAQDAPELERIARLERAARRGLGALDWLDDLVRPHLHDVRLALHRTEERELALAEALALSGGLFAALEHAIASARATLDEVEAGLARATQTGSAPAAERRTAGAHGVDVERRAARARDA